MDSRLKKLLIFIAILTITVIHADAGNIMFVRNVTGGSSATNYTQLSGVRGAWYMNGGDGNETDRSSNGANLTEAGTVSGSSTVPSSYSGNSRSFPGSNGDTLSQADGGSLDFYGADQAISACCWFYSDAVNAERTLMSKGRITDTESWRFFVENDPASIRVTMSSDGTTTVTAAGATSISASTWYHACFVYNDTDIRLYLNGSLDSNSTENPLSYTSGMANSSEPFYISRSASQYWDGLIDEAIIFNIALTSTQVGEIYTNGIDGTKGGND